MKKRIGKVINTLLAPTGYQLAKKTIIWSQLPIEASLEDAKLIDEALQFSMTNKMRMYTLLQSLKYVTAEKVEGDCIECGVWRGGNLILMRKYLDSVRSSRMVLGYDTFEGMPEPTSHDVDIYGNDAKTRMAKEIKSEKIHNVHAYAGLQRVRENLRSMQADNNVRLIQGKVEDTLVRPENLPEKIAVLRLDTDWYESTKVELETLFPRLSPGGVLIIDDYGHYKGAQKAVDDYFSGKFVWLHYVDYACRMVIKTAQAVAQ